MAKDELEAVVEGSRGVLSTASSGDFATARSELAGLTEHAATAAELTSDPVWRAAEIVPWLGANLRAVRVAAAEGHAVLARVAAPVLDGAETVTAGPGPAETGALLDVAALRTAAPRFADASRVAVAAQQRLTELDTDALLPPVTDGVRALSDAVGGVTPAVTALADAAAVLPTMLGADEPRTVLVMIQNNAELRTGGGITGTFLELSADQGRLTITAQSESADFEPASEGIVEIPESTSTLYGGVVDKWVANTAMSADFTVTADLASTWWHTLTGHRPDAIVSIDPIVLQALLRAHGPVETSEGAVTADDVVQRLLVEPYMTRSQAEQTALFEEVAHTVFGSLTSSATDPLRLASTLAQPLADGRVSVWSAHGAEQSVLADTWLAGPSARQAQSGSDAYAVYFNDATGGKMDSYLDVAIASGAASCDAGTRAEIAVTLTNSAPAEASSWPFSMTGGGRWGAPAGGIATIVTVSAPEGSFYGGVDVDGASIAPTTVEDAGFPVSATTVVLAPGETKTITFEFLRRGAAVTEPVVLHTPLLVTPDLTRATPSCG